jgi:hypothetical protein
VPVDANLDSLAASSPFIFIGSIVRTAASSPSMPPAEPSSVVVGVEDIIQLPAGLTGLTGGEVTVRLQQPLAPGRYVFFAVPWAVGRSFVVEELGHLDATSPLVREQVVAALEGAYENRLTQRIGAATLVALGRVGAVHGLGSGGGGREDVMEWAVAPLEIERTLWGDQQRHQVLLIGPRVASRHIPSAPALQAGVQAIFILRPPPREAADALPEADRERALFIAEPSDIQPPERLLTVDQIARGHTLGPR